MHTPFCAELHTWIAEAGTPAPPPALCAHIAGCAHCRARLAMLAAELLQAPLEPGVTTCDQCQEDLAAYIDIERDEGMAVAMGAYPQVWWHLWTCADCAETYRLVGALQGAEAAGEIPPIPLASLVAAPPPRATPSPIQRFTLPRAALQRIFSLRLATTWGADDETIIHDDEDAGYQVGVSVRKRDGRWLVVVTVAPPIVGEAVVMLGEATFRAPFDPYGVAVLDAIPEALLTGAGSPDLSVSIEPAGP